MGHLLCREVGGFSASCGLDFCAEESGESVSSVCLMRRYYYLKTNKFRETQVSRCALLYELSPTPPKEK